jgi:hypothetical protein
MRPTRPLLHALLCFALVANGVGAAMASVHGGCGHARADTVVSAPAAMQVASEAHCAGMTAMDASEAAPEGMHHDMPADDANPAGDDANVDCDGACSCACASHGFTALMPPMLILPAAGRIADGRSPARTHAAPSLPHPTRPPIG